MLKKVDGNGINFAKRGQVPKIVFPLLKKIENFSPRLADLSPHRLISVAKENLTFIDNKIEQYEKHFFTGFLISAASGLERVKFQLKVAHDLLQGEKDKGEYEEAQKALSLVNKRMTGVLPKKGGILLKEKVVSELIDEYRGIIDDLYTFSTDKEFVRLPLMRDAIEAFLRRLKEARVQAFKNIVEMVKKEDEKLLKKIKKAPPFDLIDSLARYQANRWLINEGWWWNLHDALAILKK